MIGYPIPMRALIFDFDGTILDTEITLYRAWCELYGERNCLFPIDRWALSLGRGADWQRHFDPVAHLAELSGVPCDDEVRKRANRRNRELLAAEAPRPGVFAYLDAARELDLRLAIASSSPRRWIVEHLDRLGLLDRFELLRCEEDCARHKPEPDLYLAALEGLGVAADEAIAIEDSPNGVRAAQAAGIFCVAVPNPVTAQLDLSHADLRLDSLEALALSDLLSRVASARPGTSTGTPR
jgi:HAD superfamily hydrolase (TIGR01509 family)